MAVRTSPDRRIVGCAVLVQIPGYLIEVAADPAVLCGQLPDSGEQFIIGPPTHG